MRQPNSNEPRPSGQFDLFGGMGDQAVDSGLSLNPAIPISEWDKAILLSFEREMLGLYVSDHPLYGLEQVLASGTDCSIARIGNDERSDNQIITIGGLVTGIARKTTKQGSTWAIVTLEDLEGAIEVMVFPQTYQAVATMIAEDAVVFVRGRIDRPDDDSPRLVAMEITAPDLSEAPAGPVRLMMPAARCTPPIVERLKAILSEHPGVTEVQLHLTSQGKTTVMRLDDRLRVTPAPALYGDLKALLGPSCLA